MLFEAGKVFFRVIGLHVPEFLEPGKVEDTGREEVMGCVRGVFRFCARNSPESPNQGTDKMCILKK